MNAGIPMTVPSTNVNKVCLSGLNTIYLADQHHRSRRRRHRRRRRHGVDDERAAHRSPVLAGGLPLRRHRLSDAIIHDGLWCAFDACLMGAGTEKYAASRNISRERQDDLAAKSHERAAAAIKDGRFNDEVIAVRVPQRKGDPLLFDTDEGVRPGTTLESLGALKPAFDKARHHHRRQRVAAVRRRQRGDRGVEGRRRAPGVAPLGEIVSYGQVAGPRSRRCCSQPSRAIQAALEKAGKSVADIDLFEINEAFAAVGIASMADLGITDEVVNVNGGAIALGHPIGMSGNRLALTLLHELRRRGGGLGAAALCGGGGQGDALLVRSL